MVQLNLTVFDENHQKIDGMSIENAAPQQVNAVFMFLKPGMSYQVDCVAVEPAVNEVRN